MHREIEIALSYFPKRYRGVCLDVGAGPNRLSLTADLEHFGWTVHCFEANPVYVDDLQAAGRQNVHQSAVGDHCDDETTFFVYRTKFDMASFSGLICHDWSVFGRHADLPVEPEEILVPLKTLDCWLEELEIETVDLVKIDVEGSEADVLVGFDLERWRPRVLIVENWYKNSRLNLIEHGYNLVERIDYNEIFVAGKYA